MKKNPRSLFPKKVTKSIQRFLTEESGRITKKDALGISAAWVLAAWFEEVVAGHSSNYPTNSSPASFYPYPGDDEVPNNGSKTNTWTIVTDSTCNHSSGVVNGHYSNVPNVNNLSEDVEYTKSHNSHSSHGSHGSGGWC